MDNAGTIIAMADHYIKKKNDVILEQDLARSQVYKILLLNKQNTDVGIMGI